MPKTTHLGCLVLVLFSFTVLVLVFLVLLMFLLFLFFLLRLIPGHVLQTRTILPSQSCDYRLADPVPPLEITPTLLRTLQQLGRCVLGPNLQSHGGGLRNQKIPYSNNNTPFFLRSLSVTRLPSLPLPFNLFTPKKAEPQISPAASPGILHHTVWRTWLSIAYADGRWLYYQFLFAHLYIPFSLLSSKCTFSQPMYR